MKVRFDPETGALYIRLDDAPVIESDEVRPGLVVDYDAADRVVGMEIRDAGKRISPEQLKRIEFEVA